MSRKDQQYSIKSRFESLDLFRREYRLGVLNIWTYCRQSPPSLPLSGCSKRHEDITKRGTEPYILKCIIILHFSMKYLVQKGNSEVVICTVSGHSLYL